MKNSGDSNWSHFGSSSNSNPSNIAVCGDIILNRIFSSSEEKHLDLAQREETVQILVDTIKNETKENQIQNVNIIEDYGVSKEISFVENRKPPVINAQQKLHDSLITASSPSRGSVLTNPQQPGGRFGSSLNNSNTQETFPLRPGKAIQIYKSVLSEYEKGEILNYREIYYVGENAANKKV